MGELDDDAVGYAPDHPAVLASLTAFSFGRKTWEAGRDECLAWADVRGKLDPGASSNTGLRYICWVGPRGTRGHRGSASACYAVTCWIDGERKLRHMRAPETLQEARGGPLLAAAVKRRDAHPMPESVTAKNRSTSREFRAVIETTPEGRTWLAAGASDRVGNLLRKAVAGEVYGLDGWHRESCVHSHIVLASQPDRAKILSGGITYSEALALLSRRTEDKAARLRLVTPPRSARRPYLLVDSLPASTSRGLLAAFRAGCTKDQIDHAWGTLLDAAANDDDRVLTA